LKSFQLNTRLPLEQSIRKVLEDTIYGMDLVEGHITDPSRTVHDTRKTIKRIRALLKMIRDGSGYGFYFRENRFFRDLSRRMAPARDSCVLLETLGFLEKKYPGRLKKAGLNILRDHLTGRMEAHLMQLTKSPEGFPFISGELENALQRINETLSISDEFDSIGTGIGRIYRRARNCLLDLDQEPRMELLHEYRKNCRYLQFQIELIQSIFPAVLKAYSSGINDHTEVLGKIRDYQRFEVYLENNVPGVLPAPELALILDAVKHQRSKAMNGLFPKARILFAEKSGAFLDRIHLYWNVHFNLI